MYTALGIMIFGILCGRIFGRHLREGFIQKTVMAAIFLLLFLLGLSIGANDALFSRLPELGTAALVIALFCLAGSIAVSVLLTPFIKGRSAAKK